MVWWIAVVLIACDLCLAAIFTPWRVRVSLQGRGEPEGVWALGGGIQLGPVALSGAAARGAEAAVQLHLLGRRLWGRSLRALVRRAATGTEAEDEPERDTPLRDRIERGWRRLRDRARRFEAWFDPWPAAWFLLGELRRVRPRRLYVDVDYSFEDVVLTGRVLAAIYLLRGVLPPEVVIHQHHSWNSEDRVHGAIEGEILIWPVLAAIEVLWYAVRRIKIRRRHLVVGETTEPT